MSEMWANAVGVLIGSWLLFLFFAALVDPKVAARISLCSLIGGSLGIVTAWTVSA